MNIHITEGQALYIPKITKVDDFGRHSLTLIPEDQSIINKLEEERSDKIEALMTTNNLPDGAMPNRPTWKWSQDSNNFSITFNWKPEAVRLGKVYVFDEHEKPITDQYLDRQLTKATFKMSFVQETYFFDRDGQTIFGTALRPRKIKVMKLADFTDFSEGAENIFEVNMDNDF